MKNSAYPDLCRTFRELAAWTWNKLDTANRLGMSFNEEPITESLLLKLAERHAGRDLTIRAYTKNEEGKGTKKTNGKPTGADWSFWISNSRNQGKELRIQAKRLFWKKRDKSGYYKNLDGTSQQIKDLWRNKGDAIPLYVFYNGPPHPNLPFAHWHRYCWPEFWRDADWGCSFAHITAIPPKDKPTARDIKYMHPWHYLACECAYTRGTKTGSLPERMISVLEEIYKQTGSHATDDSRFEGAKEISFELNNSPPAWVKLLKAAKSEDEDEPSETNEELDQYLETHGLKGVAFIQEVKNI